MALNLLYLITAGANFSIWNYFLGRVINAVIKLYFIKTSAFPIFFFSNTFIQWRCSNFGNETCHSSAVVRRHFSKVPDLVLVFHCLLIVIDKIITLLRFKEVLRVKSFCNYFDYLSSLIHTVTISILGITN